MIESILAFETSCDDTGIALYHGQRGLLGHILHSQTERHRQYGGVVPEWASRDHMQFLLPLLTQLLQKTGTQPAQIHGIAYTAGPGLMGSLLVGAGFARALGYAWKIPTLGIHHLEGHLLAPFLESQPPQFPFTALLVSGGHTQLVNVQALGKYTILGESLDDAAGEAFDKVAKLLGLPYPGGALLAQLAEQGDPHRFKFPRPLTDRPGLDFSFSGLKTHTQQAFAKTLGRAQDKADIAYAFQRAVIDTLVIKCQRALENTQHTQLVIAGGVSANQKLREALHRLMEKQQGTLFYARPEFCTDNGAMTAYAGYQRMIRGEQDDSLHIRAQPRWLL
jgi:N6-L-threonylcarbamoyladenine synthase